MIILKKIPYYLNSLIRIVLMVKNPSAILSVLQRKRTLLRLRNGLKIFASQPLDLLILKETIIDDSYQLRDMKNPKRIIDIGGALGDTALWANLLHPQCIVDVFEPNPDSIALLRENIQINKAGNKIHLHEYAVGTKKEYSFFISVYNVRSSIVKDQYSEKEIKVKGTSLEKYLETDIDLLKVDTEGSELEVLKSIKPKSFLKIKKIILEYHNHLIPDQDKKIRAFLAKFPYELSQVQDAYNQNIGYIIAHLKPSGRK